MASGDNPRRHPDSAYRSVGEEGGMVVMSGRSEVQVLNPVGIKIFSMLDGSHSSAEIAMAVVQEFEVSEEQAAEDLRAFLAELDRNGMLESSNGAEGTAK